MAKFGGSQSWNFFIKSLVMVAAAGPWQLAINTTLKIVRSSLAADAPECPIRNDQTLLPRVEDIPNLWAPGYSAFTTLTSTT